ncbi:DUF1080 domain-containing protein [candidate division KSB1 bacterium]|nr:DUF1080 domain-containing protein [candidate division KSB1 bacterium]
MACLALLCACSFSTGEGWQDLFNGKDLSNFEVLNGDGQFIIEDDEIVGVSRMDIPNTFLATKKAYSDFILEYEIKIEAGLNSGVQIRSLSLPEYKNGRVHGYQIEMDPSKRAWTGGFYEEGRRGWLYNLECNPKAKTAFKAEDWNHFRVEAIGSHFRVWLNGVPSADVMDELIPEGFIALQLHAIYSGADEGKTVRFRNIKILTDDPESMALPITNAIPQVSYLTNQLTEREKAEGWQLLWDGKSTTGWRGAKLDQFPESGWKIEDGILAVQKSDGGESTNGGDIVTVQQFGDFELEVDFKITKGANSGIKYFVDTELNQGEGSSIGCEYQILDDANHPDAKQGTDGNRTLASLYDIIPANAHYFSPNESTSKRVNTYGWNRAKIIVRGNHVEHYLNGIQVIEYERRTQTWRALVARSKYVVWPNFGERETGHILLQDHGDEVQFKNIKMKTEAGS